MCDGTCGMEEMRVEYFRCHMRALQQQQVMFECAYGMQ